MKRNQTRRLTLAAMMGAVSFVLMYFSFSVPVLSPFASFDLSALPDLIGGFVLGPVGAVEIIAVKVLLKLVFKGTSSMFTGEIQKFLLCTAYALPAVQALHSAGVISGMPDGSFQPQATTTREQACVVLCAL